MKIALIEIFTRFIYNYYKIKMKWSQEVECLAIKYTQKVIDVIKHISCIEKVSNNERIDLI